MKKKELLKEMLLERIALRGICRVIGVSLIWLLEYIVKVYEKLPETLNAEEVGDYEEVCLWKFEAQADEVWSFVGSKANRQWIALDGQSKQVIAFHVSDHSEESAKKLWEKIHKLIEKMQAFLQICGKLIIKLFLPLNISFVLKVPA